MVSGEITTYFSLQFSTTGINTIKELVETDMTLTVWPSFVGLNWISDKELLNTIIEKYTSTKTNLPISELLSNKDCIVSASEGKTAIFLFDALLKVIALSHSNYLDHNTKFRFLDEHFGAPYVETIATSRKLPKAFRDQVNLK